MAGDDFVLAGMVGSQDWFDDSGSQIMESRRGS